MPGLDIDISPPRRDPARMPVVLPRSLWPTLVPAAPDEVSLNLPGLDVAVVPNGADRISVGILADQLEAMFSRLQPAAAQRMRRRSIRIDVIPRGAHLTDLPAWSHLQGKKTFDGRDWADVGGVASGTRCAIAEEDIAKGFTAAHEVGHVLRWTALSSGQRSRLEKHLDARRDDPFAQWLSPGWYTKANVDEYFAQCVAAYFEKPYGFAVRQFTRAWLQDNDPEVLAILDEVFVAP
jgi:hypothetical protein